MTETLAASEPVDVDLLERLEAFQLDDPTAALTFSRRLARENGWTHDFALRVVDEYKRFVYLAMTAGHEVTPSDEVDQAWHLHLTYTRSYWDEMCGNVLGRPLHHGPTKGGEAEGERFEDQYERTLESYRRAFGQEAPSDIWPPAEVRFGDAAYFVRVNTRRRRSRPVLLGGLAAIGLVGLAPLANAAKEEEWFFTVFSYIVIGAVITVILKAVFKAATGRDWKGGDHGCSSGGFWGGCGGGSDSGGCGSSCGGGCGGGCGG